MAEESGVSSVAIDLTRLHRRTVTSFYSNLVTRPTGRAVRMGVESQLGELDATRRICLSVLDFSQVHVLDYSCADEIVAKLLLRYVAEDRPAEAYFVARGLQEHHQEAVEAVLERHGLLLVALEDEQQPRLLGPSNPFERRCWASVQRLGQGSARQVSGIAGLPEEVVGTTLARLGSLRVVAALDGGIFCDLSSFARDR